MIASGATTPNNRVADDQGFLRQWSKVAKERKLQRLYIGEPSAEAVAAQMPDLILISATGGDSALALYDQLSTIAPTLIINYDDKSWQSLLTQLGEITGHEKQAAERIALFDKQLAAAKEQIKLPPQPVTALVYTASRCCTQCQSLDAGISTRADAGTTRLYAGEVARRLKRQPKPGQTP
ncbi:hypothetical protein EIMP300_71770 [Escherichia coli]|uniref:Fe/B12 periplasmic-binding domain-containing protein n=1 Tax=Escherichia coli TaxID=562 RepID=A0A8S0G0T4_ECOLX|nr:hypothetical protein EIMP300_71770 [Escherichia coli]